MSAKNTKGYILIAAAAAIAAPALLAQPAAAEGDYAGYRYRAFQATETQQEKTKRTAALAPRQNVRAGTSDADLASKPPRTRSFHFNFDVPVDEEQHYRD